MSRYVCVLSYCSTTPYFPTYCLPPTYLQPFRCHVCLGATVVVHPRLVRNCTVMVITRVKQYTIIVRRSLAIVVPLWSSTHA